MTRLHRHRWLVVALLVFATGFIGASSLLGRESLSTFVNNPAFRWETNQTEHITIYYEAGSATVPRLSEIAANVEASRSSVLRLIQEKDFADRIHVFLVDNRPRTKDLIGQPSFGGAIAKLRVVYAVVNATNNGCSTHELCHVIAGAMWGKPERWLDEGLATFSDERWPNRDALAGKLARDGKLLPLETLARDFLKHPEGVTYVESASFLGFVIERFGMEKFKSVWRGGFKSIPQVLGHSADELEAEWRASLAKKAAEAEKSAAK